MGDTNAPVNKRRMVLIREQHGEVTTTQVTGRDAQEIAGPDDAISLRLTKTGNTYAQHDWTAYFAARTITTSETTLSPN